MPVQGWVKHWLERYCPPGQHDFREGRAGLLVCSRCNKEELVGGATCIICGIPGEHAAVLVHTNGDSARVPGKLCGPCLDDFAASPSIRGWRVETAI